MSGLQESLSLSFLSLKLIKWLDLLEILGLKEIK